MEQEDKTSFDLSKYIQPLLRRKWWWIASITIIGIGAIVYAINKPDIYESRCVLLVEKSKVLRTVLLERDGQLDARQLLQAVSERMLGWQPVTRVIREVGLDKEFPKDDIRALEKLYRSIVQKVTLDTKGKDFIVVSYRGGNPEINFGIVNGLVSDFMERSLESSRNEAYETLEFIEGDLERLKRNLDESERKFRRFEEEHIEELPGNENSILPKLYIAKSELAEVDREIMGLNEKLKFLENRKGEESKTITGEIVTIPNPKLEDFNDRIINLEIDITRLRARYYDNHPRIIQMQKELAHLNKVLEEESEKVITEEKIVNNPMYESILERGFEMRLELKSLRSHRKEIESTIAGFKPTLENIPALKQTLFELGTDYNINKKLYEDRLLQKSKAILVKEMSLDAKSNPFNVVEPPRISYAPINLIKIKIIGMGFLLGIGLGIGLVFGLEQIDQRFKTVDEIQDYLQIPALGVIPTILTREDSKKEVYRKAG